MADKSDPFQSSSRDIGSDLQADEDDPEKKKKRLQSLMNRLKVKSSRLGTLAECTHNYCKYITDKRNSSIIVSSQLDILQRNFTVFTLPLMLERLKMCSRNADLTYSYMKRNGVWTASIGTERFLVEVQVLASGRVEEVSVSLSVNSDTVVVPRRCPLLVKILRNKEFELFTKHLQGYSNIYSAINDRQRNNLCYVVLEAMETNIDVLSHGQIITTASQICKSAVGFVTTRSAGLPLRTTYFIGPYDLLLPKSTNSLPLTIEVIKEQNLGHSFTLEIQSSVPHKFAVRPIYGINKAADGTTSIIETNLKEWCELPAVFVMKLKSGIPMSSGTIEEIQELTGIEFLNESSLEPLLPLIVKNTMNKDQYPNSSTADDLTKGQSVYLPGWKHRYYIGEDSECITSTSNQLSGCIVDKILFTSANCIVQVISLLRNQTAFNTVIESCVRQPATSKGGAIVAQRGLDLDSSCEARVFQVYSESLESITVIFEDPLEESLSSCDFDMSDFQSLKCTLYSTYEDNFCSDSYLCQVFQRSFSLPITMRAILRKGTEKLKLINKQKSIVEPMDTSQEDMTHERPTANPMLASLLDDSLSNGTNDHVDRVHVKVQGSTSPRSPCPAKRRKRGIEADAHHTSPLSSAAFLLTAHQRPPPSVLSIKSVSRKQEPASNSSYNNTSSSNTSLDYSPNQNELLTILKHDTGSESPLRLNNNTPSVATDTTTTTTTTASTTTSRSRPEITMNGLTSPNWTATTPQSSITPTSSIAQSNFHSRTNLEAPSIITGDTRFKGGGGVSRTSQSDRKSFISEDARMQTPTTESDPFDFNASLGVQASMPSPVDGITASDALTASTELERSLKKDTIRPSSGGGGGGGKAGKSTLTVKLNTKLINKDASMPNSMDSAASMKRPRSKDSSKDTEEDVMKAVHKKQKLLAKQLAAKKRRMDGSPSDKKREYSKNKNRIYDFDDTMDSIGANDVNTPPPTPPKSSTESRSKSAPTKIKISGGRIHITSQSSSSKSKEKVSKSLSNSLSSKSRSKESSKEIKAAQIGLYLSSSIKQSSKQKQPSSLSNHSGSKSSSPITIITKSDSKSSLGVQKKLNKEVTSSPTHSNNGEGKPAPIKNRKSSLTAVIDKLTKTKQTPVSDKQKTIPPPDEGPKTKASADMIRLMILSQGNLPSTPPKDGSAITPGCSTPILDVSLTSAAAPLVGKVPLAKIPSRTPSSSSPPTITTPSINSSKNSMFKDSPVKVSVKESKVKVPNLLSVSANFSKNSQKFPNHRSTYQNSHRSRPLTSNSKNTADQKSPPRPSLLPTPPNSQVDQLKPSTPSSVSLKIGPYQRPTALLQIPNKQPVSILKNASSKRPLDSSNSPRLSNGDLRLNTSESRKSPLNLSKSLQPILPPAINSNPASPLADDDFVRQSTVLAQPLSNNSPECSESSEDEEAFVIDDEALSSPAAPAYSKVIPVTLGGGTTSPSPTLKSVIGGDRDRQLSSPSSEDSTPTAVTTPTTTTPLSPNMCREDELIRSAGVMISETKS